MLSGQLPRISFNMNCPVQVVQIQARNLLLASSWKQPAPRHKRGRIVAGTWENYRSVSESERQGTYIVPTS